MELINEHYRVIIQTETTPRLDGYSVLHVTDAAEDFYCARLVTVEDAAGEMYRFALLDFVISFADPYAVLEENILTVLLFRTILQIDLRAKTVLRCVDCENMGGLEEIFLIDGGYIIKGEGEIFRYDQALNPVWQRAGRDIFARPTAEKCFWLENGLIHCRDWEGWHYVLNLDGERLSEFPET